MLNKKEKESLTKVIQFLNQLLTGSGVTMPELSFNPAFDGPKKTDTPFAGMKKSTRDFYNAVLAKYGENPVTVKDNEALRKIIFDTRVSSLGLTVKRLHDKGLATTMTAPIKRGEILLQFSLKKV